MAAFPGDLASFAGFIATHTLAADNHAAQHNLEQAEILAVQTKVGIDNSADANSLTYKIAALQSTNSSQDSEIATLFGDITTLLASISSLVSSLATKASLAGAESLSNKTLITPVIASFINAQHNHQNGAGGGVLSFGALLATIFSDQLQTFNNAGTAGGTFFYINLGGIKFLWGETASQSVGIGGASWTITLPTPFFSSIQAALVSLGPVGSESRQYVEVASKSTTTITIFQQSVTNGATQISELFVIGS